MLLWKILKTPWCLIGFFREVCQGPFSRGADKWEAWKILIDLSFKSFFETKSKKIKHYRIFGFSVYCYKYWTLLYLFREIFLNDHYHFNHADRNPVIIDCGANIGMSVLFFKKLFPESRILAFEPNPFAFQLLEKNVGSNHLKYVELYNVALSKTEGTSNFFVDDDKGTLLGSLFEERGGPNSFDVETKKLSSVVTKIKPDLVKIDVEGSEHEIIEDLQSSEALALAGQYIIEYHHQIKGQKPKLAGFLKKFESAQFSYNLKSSFTTTGQFQDIIIHFMQAELKKKAAFTRLNARALQN